MDCQKIFESDYARFMDQVRDEAGLYSHGDAARVSRAVLETLGECIGETSFTAIRGQLPKDIAEFLEFGDDGPLDYPVATFVNRVAERALIEKQQAFQCTSVVLWVLCRFLEERAVCQLRQDLGLPYAAFFPPAATEPWAPPLENTNMEDA